MRVKIKGRVELWAEIEAEVYPGQRETLTDPSFPAEVSDYQCFLVLPNGKRVDITEYIESDFKDFDSDIFEQAELETKDYDHED